jgi:competence protein ComEA
MKNVIYVMIGIIVGLLAGLLIAGGIKLTSKLPEGDPVTLLPTSTPNSIVVYITGAVAKSGVYTLPDGSRVQDLIDAAGGFIPGAKEDQINLAALLWDGAQIIVPGMNDEGHISSGRININSATAEELETLPGIGRTAAQSIVEYRIQHGPFQTIQDIQNVPGIGPATFDKIKDLITVGP